MLRRLMMAGGSAPPSPSAHRYWRVLITANDGDAQYVGFTEIEMRGSIGGPNLLVPQSAVNRAATANNSVNSNNEAWRATDLSMSSGWLGSATALPAWWKYDFGSPWHSGASSVEIKQIVIYGSWNAPSASPRDFQLQWSDDNTSWTTVLTVSGQTGWTGASDARTFNVP